MRNPSIKALQQKALRQKKRGQLEEAEKSLAEAIRVAAALLADLHGTLGGTLREQGRLHEAAGQYDRGYNIDEQYGIVSSYNALNRLLTRLLARGAPGRPPVALANIDVQEELRKVHAMLDGRLGKNQPPDYWAAGDLALVSALMADEPGMKKGLKLFTGPSTPAYAYDAYLNTLSKLLQVEVTESAKLRRLRQGLERAKASAPSS